MGQLAFPQLIYRTKKHVIIQLALRSEKFNTFIFYSIPLYSTIPLTESSACLPEMYEVVVSILKTSILEDFLNELGLERYSFSLVRTMGNYSAPKNSIGFFESLSSEEAPAPCWPQIKRDIPVMPVFLYVAYRDLLH